MKEMGHGKGYKYAHDYDGASVDQEHLPESIKGHRYYEPTDRGREEKIRAWMEKMRKIRDGG